MQACPPHKQWQHTLVLYELQQLISKVEKEKGITFKAAEGDNIVVETPEFNLELPISIPQEVIEKNTNKGLVKNLNSASV